jgi:hypothetical protein
MVGGMIVPSNSEAEDRGQASWPAVHGGGATYLSHGAGFVGLPHWFVVSHLPL